MMAQLSPITKSRCLFSVVITRSLSASQRFAVLGIQARSIGALEPEGNSYLVGYGKISSLTATWVMQDLVFHRSLLLALQGACEPSDTASWVRVTFGFTGSCTLVHDRRSSFLRPVSHQQCSNLGGLSVFGSRDRWQMTSNEIMINHVTTKVQYRVNFSRNNHIWNREYLTRLYSVLRTYFDEVLCTM